MSGTLKFNIRKALPDFALEVSAIIKPGFTILFGPSGAGKTSLLDCIAGLVRPDSGSIAAGGVTFFDSSRGVHLGVRARSVGYVFQDLALFPHLTARENIEFGLSGHASGERVRLCGDIMDAFGIRPVAHRKPSSLSGGEAQRVALARTLITEPCLLLLDEPLAALDAATKSRIIADLRAWNGKRKLPILYVTHSREEVFALGERVLLLDRGRITSSGTPHEVMTAPHFETAAQLAGFENVYNAEVSALNEGRGTMTCRIATGDDGALDLETPLLREPIGARVKVGIRAGDILLANRAPQGLSARNIFAGEVVSLERRDVIVSVKVNCGVIAEVHVTLSARDSLNLHNGQSVWLIVKTHSCHLMATA